MYFIIIAVLIGSIIGAFTNHLAIKMLFRPYKPWRIGSWQVPFTPGLIPKRREEIAKRLGIIVEEYLFTATGMKEFVNKTNLKEKLFNKLINDLQKYKEKNKKVSEEISVFVKEDWKTSLRNYKDKKLSEFIGNEKIRGMSLEDVLSEESLINIDRKFDDISVYLINSIKEYLLSIEGKRKLKLILSDLFNRSGMIGFFAGLFIDFDQINEKALIYLENTLKQEETEQSVKHLISNIWNKIKREPIGNLMDKFNDTLKVELDHLFNKGLEHLDNTTTGEFITKMEEDKLIERIYDLIITLVIENLDRLFSYLSISDVVEAEVNNFSIAYFEKMILEISGRELKMITYLGGLIGGLIGLLQGVFYILY